MLISAKAGFLPFQNKPANGSFYLTAAVMKYIDLYEKDLPSSCEAV